ncbi:MAG: hypothetical protein AAB933_00330 [Patescibacteria group bacterium]
MIKFFKQKNKGPAPYEAGGFRSGFTLVETLIAVSIFTVSILALMSVLASGIANTNYAKRKMIASYLAQEGIEYVRNMRDTYVLYNDDWNKFSNDLNQCNNGGDQACGFGAVLYDIKRCNQLNDCKLYLENGNYSSTGSIDSGFVRKIWKEDIGSGQDDEVKIFSKVEWTQGSGNYEITFSENLFNWQ